MAKKPTREQLELKLTELEEQLHISNNSKEYWSHEYHELLDRFLDLKHSTNENPIFDKIKNLSITDALKINEFINNL